MGDCLTAATMGGAGGSVSLAALCGVVLAGCGGGDDGLVVRTVSEYGGTPIAGVKVQVGEQPWTTTGSNGEARFTSVAPPYTVRVYQPMTFATRPGLARQNDKVWQLIGQTGNPLVLEVDGSLAQIYKAHASGTVAGRSGAASTQVLVQGSRAAPDGTFGSSNGPVIWWEGATSTDFVLRAVESGTEQPPAHYTGYAANRVRLTDTPGFLGPGGNLYGMTLQLGPIEEARVSGQVTRPEALSQGTLTSTIALRFSPYEWLGLGEGHPSGQPAAFDYAVPRIGGAAPWLRFFAAAG